MDEKTLKIALYHNLNALGFKVFSDEHTKENLNIFKGNSRHKPDLLVFHRTDCKEVSNPFGIELKVGGHFNIISKAIMQMGEYKKESYKVDDKNITPTTMLLSTTSAILSNEIYSGSIHYPFTCSEDGRLTNDWNITRQLFSLGENRKQEQFYFGLFKKKDDQFYIQFPNFHFDLYQNGILKKVDDFGI